MPITQRMASTVGDRRFGMNLLSFFGVLAALLAAVGIYGVMAYAVGVRSRELGLRMALGAARGSVLGLVLRQAVILVGAGVAGGLVIAWWGASLLERLVFGVSPRDPLTFVAAAALIAAVALLAAWIPARRATRLDPVRTLQEA
jgi:ABC-type antimicrobial peptide transport system permease subunit